MNSAAPNPKTTSEDITIAPLADSAGGESAIVSILSGNVDHNIKRMRDLWPTSKVRITYTVEAID